MEAVLTRITTLLTLLVLVTSTGWAQEKASPPGNTQEDQTGGIALDETVFWDIQSVDPGVARTFRNGVRESLADAAAKHLLSKDAFRDHVATRAPDTPGCFRGVSECVAPGAIAFDALGLSSVIRVELTAGRAEFRVLDSRGRAIREGEVTAKSPRDLAFAVVREIFDATGVVSVESEPPGATVEIDGRPVGTTPLTHRVDVGTHSYTLRIPDRKPVQGEVEVASGKAVDIRHDLTLLPGTLIVQDAPEGAEVFVNGNLAGRAGEPIELEPGNYTLEVRASGYETMRDAVTVEPGLSVKRSAPLQESNPFLRDVSSDAIIFNNYILRFGFELGLQRATFRDARSNDDSPVEFAGLADDDGTLPSDLIIRETLGTAGLRIDASYTFKRFGLVALSLSYLSRKTNLDGFADAPGVGEVPVTLTAVRRLQVRPFQVFYRHFVKNFVPFIEGGIGINFLWVQAEGPDFSGPETLRRVDALWTLAMGGQYYFNENFFGMARYSIQDYFEAGLGTDHQVSLGIGAAFSNLFGFDTEPPETL
jgi:hypothetical protein